MDVLGTFTGAPVTDTLLQDQVIAGGQSVGRNRSTRWSQQLSPSRSRPARRGFSPSRKRRHHPVGAPPSCGAGNGPRAVTASHCAGAVRSSRAWPATRPASGARPDAPGAPGLNRRFGPGARPGPLRSSAKPELITPILPPIPPCDGARVPVKGQHSAATTAHGGSHQHSDCDAPGIGARAFLMNPNRTNASIAVLGPCALAWPSARLAAAPLGLAGRLTLTGRQQRAASARASCCVAIQRTHRVAKGETAVRTARRYGIASGSPGSQQDHGSQRVLAALSAIPKAATRRALLLAKPAVTRRPRSGYARQLPRGPLLSLLPRPNRGCSKTHEASRAHYGARGGATLHRGHTARKAPGANVARATRSPHGSGSAKETIVITPSRSRLLRSGRSGCRSTMLPGNRGVQPLPRASCSFWPSRRAPPCCVSGDERGITEHEVRWSPHRRIWMLRSRAPLALPHHGACGERHSFSKGVAPRRHSAE